ncbi:MAG: patatin-like phospholipase family protein [Spirochaetales bacterium]|nr:patatin-like phospholipase family protein [Spirochaetales bacterium]
MKKVGVAFGGGGARGLAHLGVIRALRNSGKYIPEITAGTSAGSIAAVLYASGLSQLEIEETAKEFDWFKDVISFSDTVKNFFNRNRGGLVSNAKLGDSINRLISGRSFDDFNIDIAVVATEIEKMQRVIFTSKRAAAEINREELEKFLPKPKGPMPGCDTIIVPDCKDVGLAVRASCAVPGLFQPVEIMGLRLLDGGVVDQVPVDVVKAMGADITIGVSLALSFIPQKFTSAVHSLSGMVGLLGIQQLRKNLENADIGFQVEGIDKRSPVNPKQYDLIDLGEKQMIRLLDEYERKKRKLPGILFGRKVY